MKYITGSSRLSRLINTNKSLSAGKIVRGGPGQSNKKSSDNVFIYFFFIVLSLFYRSQMVNFREIYQFSRFQRGSNIFQGSPTFSRRGGVQLLIPYRNPYNLRFSRGVPDPLSPTPPPPPPPPLWMCTCC